MTEDKKGKAYPVITLDGPAGAGKSSMAKYLASALEGFAYLDTGAMYRTVALALSRNGFKPDDVTKSRAAVVDTACNCRMRAEYHMADEAGWIQVMRLGDLVVRDSELRTAEVSALSSACAVDPVIRDLINAACRLAAHDRSLVVDGRDAGTAVFPDAILKFYLYAPLHDRVMRRMAQDFAAGRIRPFDKVLADLEDRDKRDSTREHDPLRFPADAVWIDTGMFLEETEKHFLLDIARARLDPGSARLV